jgi:hypothetical protein
MNNHVWVDPRIRLVRPEGVRSYLLGRGWKLQPYPGPELLVFGGPTDDDGEPIVQVVPSSERMSDFSLRVEELVAALSVLEDRPAADVLTDILREQTPEKPAPEPAQDGVGTPRKPS